MISFKQYLNEAKIKFSKFTKSDDDAFAGAEDFLDGSPPMLGEVDDTLVILDKSGINIDGTSGDPDSGENFILQFHASGKGFKDSKEAMATVKRLVTIPIDRKKLIRNGFKEIGN